MRNEIKGDMATVGGWCNGDENQSLGSRIRKEMQWGTWCEIRLYMNAPELLWFALSGWFLGITLTVDN